MNLIEIEKKYRTEAALMAIIDELKSALYEHQEYAQECRLDWSSYDGRTHLYVVSGINSRVFKKVSKILEDIEGEK